MAYTPATNIPTLGQISFFQWETVTAPSPRLASPISAAATTIIFISAPLDHTGAIIATAFLMGIKNSNGYVETVLVHAGDLSVDGLTATGVTRGIRLEGLDWTTGDATLASDFNQDSAVFCNISGVLQALNTAALTAQIGANIKFNGRPLWVGNAPSSVPVFANTGARDAALTAPQNGDMCYVTSGGFYDYQGGAWALRASGATPIAAVGVAGKLEVATVAQQAAHTAVGPSGAPPAIVTGNLITASSGAGDAGKIPVLGAGGQYDVGFIPGGTDASKVPLADYTAKGDILVATAASTPVAKSVGSNNQVLIADSSQATGVKWGTTPITSGNMSPILAVRVANAANGAVTYAHGLGKTPSFIEFNALYVSVADDANCSSQGIYSNSNTYTILSSAGTSGGAIIGSAFQSTTNIIYITNSAGSAVAVVTSVDATNIVLTWTKSGSISSDNIEILIKSFG